MNEKLDSGNNTSDEGNKPIDRDALDDSNGLNTPHSVPKIPLSPEALQHLSDYSSMIQRMVLALSHLAEVAREVARGVDIKAIADVFRPIALKSKRVEILGRSN